MSVAAISNKGGGGGSGGLELIGQYTGNQTIDVSSYLNSGDTADNFLIELVSANTQSTAFASENGLYNARYDGCTPVKTLTGTSLALTGLECSVRLRVKATAATVKSATADITYNLYHISTR